MVTAISGKGFSLPEFMLLAATRQKVKILHTGHFPTSVIVVTAMGQELEVELSDLSLIGDDNASNND